ncbi:MAG: ATP-binding cassette domain-containing protein, partial [Bacillati bacterium ANGP1]
MLNVADLRVSYAGEVPALHGVSLTVGEGEAVALVGANGAGKTTLLKALAGLVEVADGGITFRGRTITRLPADERVGLGIALVPEGRRLFGRLRVRENLTLGTYTNKDPA